MWGIVLEGGGAKGAYQMGIWKALRECNLSFDGVVGTSVGALNGAMMVQGEYERGMALWESITPDSVYTDPDGIAGALSEYVFQSEHYREYRREMEETFHSKGLDPQPFADLIRNHVDESKIRSSGKTFGLVTIEMDQETGLELFLEEIPKGRLEEFLLASCFLPVFRQRLIGSSHYMDGGFFNNLPWNMLEKRGWKDLIVVRLRQPALELPVPSGGRLIQIVPGEDLGRTLDFHPDQIRKNIRLGYEDGLKAFSTVCI